MTPLPAVLLEAVTKTYGAGESAVTALDSVDLAIEPGTVFGLLGANGSGKSTLVGILSTLTRPTSGHAFVHGLDVATEPTEVRGLIGVTAQQAALDDRLSGRENLRMFARLHGLPRPQAAATADRLLEQYDLTAAADRPVRTYSGGMRRRLDIIASLIPEPALLFLDEPTTGLDPHSRNDIWTAVRELADRGTSVFLTTQYLDEADQLADRVAVLSAGRVIADDAPDALKARVGRRLSASLASAHRSDAAVRVLRELGVREPTAIDGTVTGLVDHGDLTLPKVVDLFARDGIDLADVGMHEPTLDEAYLALMGARS